MPLVMSSSCLTVTRLQAGYCGSQVPSVSLIDSFRSASSCRSITDVNALVLLPICQSRAGRYRGLAAVRRRAGGEADVPLVVASCEGHREPERGDVFRHTTRGQILRKIGSQRTD